MKQMMCSRLLMRCLSVQTLAVADQAQYIYDDLGRLA